MLSNLRRRQKGIMIVVAFVVIIAFAFLYSEYDFDQPNARSAFSILGREYRISEVQRIMRTHDVCYRVGLGQFAQTLMGQQPQQERNDADYAVNLIILRHNTKKLGIQPSVEEIGNFIKQLPAFNMTGSYDPKSFERFNSEYLAPSGFTAADLYQIAGDALSFSKLQELLAANIRPSPGEVEEYFLQDFSILTALRIDFPRANFINGEPPAAEEIAKYHTQNKERLLSDPQRRIEYVFFEKPRKPEGDAEMTPEQKAKLKAFGEKVADFARLVLAEGADFAALAKAHNVDLKKTPAFSYDEPPQDLKDAPALLADVFARPLDVPISDPIDTDKGYYLFNLLAVVEPKPLSLEKATPKIVETLVANKISERMNAAANDAREKLVAALRSGKSFTDAAASLGFEAKAIPPFSRAEPPTGDSSTDSRLIVFHTSNLSKGELSTPLPGPDGSLLLYLKDKQPVTDDTAAAKKTRIANALSGMDGRMLFEAWLQNARQAAGFQPAVAVASQ